MWSERTSRSAVDEAVSLTLEDLVAIQPQHVRGRLVRGLRQPEGERPGRGRSRSLDFDGLSPYVLGDDVRAIDWRASMRSGQTTIKLFAAASHRARVVVLDLRPELYFGTSGWVMAKTACLMAAWLIGVSQQLREPVGLIAGATTMSPRRGRRHALRLLDQIASHYEFAGENECPEPDLETAAALVGRQDEICLISDMPTVPDDMAAAARALSSRRVLRFFAVEDPLVLSPVKPGRYPVRGEDGERHVIQVRSPAANPNTAVNALIDAGWHVTRALDVLPQRGSR